jgi:hypothetical protein
MFYALGLIFDGIGGANPVFMFYAVGLIFGGIGGADFRYHVLRSRIRFR